MAAFCQLADKNILILFDHELRWRLRRDVQTRQQTTKIPQIPEVNKIQISMDLKLRSDNDDYVFD